ncbi:MAG: PKD-like domain-containing protein [Spirosomataceae bacterium]
MENSSDSRPNDNGAQTAGTFILNTEQLLQAVGDAPVANSSGQVIIERLAATTVSPTQFSYSSHKQSNTSINLQDHLNSSTSRGVKYTATLANRSLNASITASDPIPDVTATPSSQSRCSGASITPILMSGTVPGTAFDWTRDNVGTLGGSIPPSGSGNITGNLINNTGYPITVTFTITPTFNNISGTPITATITVNPLPLAAITNGNQVVCKGDYLLQSQAPLPGMTYAYAWGRSLFTDPFIPLGTASTQTITSSGVYLLTVTNQYGCSHKNSYDATVADYKFDGTLTTGDAVQTGRLNRFANVSTCAAPKSCPGTFTTSGDRLYDAYTVTNTRNVPVCATIGIASRCGTNIFCAAYLGSYNPTSLCTNYLADGGSSFTTAGFYEATIPANGTIVVVVHEVNPSTGCTGYTLTVDVPRDPALIVATPSATVCSSSPITLTAPYANTYSWTPGSATTKSITVNPSLGTTNYNVKLGYGNFGCNADSPINVVVNTPPDVTPVANQNVCAGSATSTISFSGTVPGTTFNWTNTNTAIGLASSGSGDISSFTATNTTAAPISGIITVTPVNGPCTGTPITFTITVFNQPVINSVTGSVICSSSGVANLSATGNGTIYWWDALVGGNTVNVGSTYSPNVSVTTTYYVESRIATPPAQQILMAAQSNTFPGNVRGYWFKAPSNFTITSLSVPKTVSSGPQSIAVLKFTGNVPPPVFSGSTNAFTTVFLTQNNLSTGVIPVNIPVNAGEVIGILGYRGDINSYAPGDATIMINGTPVQIERLGMQYPLSNVVPQNVWREFGSTTSIGRIEFEYTPGIVCTSSPRTPVTATVNPLVASPSSQTICTGSSITTIVSSNNTMGTAFSWTRDNTVAVTGIAVSGTGDISGTLTNTTNAPITVTFTITQTTGDCIGSTITATVLVNLTPNASTNQATVCVGQNINLSASGGSSFSWNGPAGSNFSSSAQNPSFIATNTSFSGIYTVTAITANCSPTTTVSIKVNTLPTLNISPTDGQVCVSQSINLSATSGLTGYSWSKSAGTFTSATNQPTVSFTSASPENFTLTVTASNGSCSASATASVQVNSQISPQASSNAPLCTGTTLNLLVDLSGASYTWRGPSFASTEQNPARSTFSSSMVGIYSITVSTSGGCVATAQVNVQAKPSPVPLVSSNSPLCQGNTLQLSASGGSSYAWRAPDGFSSAEQNPTRPTVSASIGGIYSITVTNSTGCTASTTLSVSVQVAALSVNPNPLNVCLGQTINLSANASPAASAFSWKGPGNFSSTTQNISTYATTTANLGIYSVSASIGSCVVTSTAEVKSGAVLQAGVVGIPCVGGTIQFTATGMSSYTWSRTTNNFNSNLPNPVIPSSTLNDAGIYFLTARSGSCFVSMLVPVMIAGTGISPSFSVTPSSFAAGATVALSAASASGVYSWSGPNSFSGNTRTKTISNFQAVNNGTYRLTLTVGTCTGYTEKNISINSATRLAAAEIEPMEMEINAYPNPVGKTLTVEVRLKEPSALQLNLVNSVGKPSGAWQLNEVTTFHKTELNLSDLQGGVYLLQAQADKQKVVKRVVKIQY